MRVIVVSITERDIRKVLLRHPWLPYDYAKRIAEDRQRMKSSTDEGRKTYHREYARLRRAEKKGEVTDVAGVVSGKYLLKKKRQKS
jgi:replication initiation and membrane attachment protein DnaB